MLYEMLTAWRPFQAENILQSVLLRIHEDPRPIQDLRPGIDEGLAGVVMKALARSRDDRYSSADEMCMALNQACESAGIVWNRAASLAAAASMERSPLPPLEEADGAAATETVLRPRAPREAAGGAVQEAPAVSRRRWLWVLAAAAVAVSAVVLFLWLWGTDTGAPSPASQAQTPSSPGRAGSTPVEATGERTEVGSSAAQAPVPAPSGDRPAANPPPAARREAAAPPRTAAEDLRALTPPQLVEEVQPQMPAGCAGQKVDLSLAVGRDGRVKSSRVLMGGRAPCVQAAQEAAMRCTFKPALNSKGEPVDGSTAIEIVFPEGP